MSEPDGLSRHGDMVPQQLEALVAVTAANSADIRMLLTAVAALAETVRRDHEIVMTHLRDGHGPEAS